MIRTVLTLASWIVAGVLLIFTVRRWLFILVALTPTVRRHKVLEALPTTEPLQSVDSALLPEVLLLAPIRNEAEVLPEFLSALQGITYPAKKLNIVLIDDGSTDHSETLIKEGITGKENWHLLSLARNRGKAQALNHALATFPQGEIVAIYDADERPQPNALQQLVFPFANKKIGGVSGRRAVSNFLASPAASYTTFENLVHQLVTLRAKNKLKLAPPMLGANCAYRRSALAQVDNFKPGALLEDSDLTLKLARAGWEIVFEPNAVSYHRVPQTITGYWRQHTRWARGFNEVAKNQARTTLFDARLPWPLRLELIVFALGYLDRLALVAAMGLAGLHRPGRGLLLKVVGTSLLTPLLQIIAALALSRQPLPLWGRVLWLPFFFGLDIAMAGSGLWETIKQSPQLWEERRTRK